LCSLEHKGTIMHRRSSRNTTVFAIIHNLSTTSLTVVSDLMMAKSEMAETCSYIMYGCKYSCVMTLCLCIFVPLYLYSYMCTFSGLYKIYLQELPCIS